MPPLKPVTSPLTDPMEATDGLLLVHVPNAVASVSVVVVPWQSENVPNIAVGAGLTTTTAVVKQPVGNTYDITSLPAETPETNPDEEPTVAIEGVLLNHVPPDVASVKVDEAPGQRNDTPEIIAGKGLTVNGAVT